MPAANKLPTSIFDTPINQELLAQATRVYLANLRQDTAKTKTRSEINRTHKKWFRQKGTGNARHGARNPNIFVGGGVAFGPTGEQNHSLTLPTKMKKAALLSALSWQKPNSSVNDGILELDGKTKTAYTLLKDKLQDDARLIWVADDISPEARRSLSNLSQVLLVSSRRLNTLQVLNAHHLLFTTSALKSLEERLKPKKK
ncbi:50S ribosomal protein L4 [Microgenomates group bacterium]|nr:50S ribosomal protein L4 [Microgenomates group bacterium]